MWTLGSTRSFMAGYCPGTFDADPAAALGDITA
jgi:hypothetical protein